MNQFVKGLFGGGLLCCTVLGATAQSFEEYKQQKIKDFNQYKMQREREFKEYRDRINAEFAEYMRQAWPQYKSKPAEPVPDLPEPPAPIVKDPDTPPSNDPVPFDEVTPIPEPVEPPQPVVPLPEPLVPVRPTFVFTFYGQQCEIPLENKHRFALTGATENSVADGWVVLSSDEYLPVLSQCLDYRDKLCLCDWGYVRFIEQMTTAFFSSAQLNEARLMQMYILVQSGYKVRIARAGEKLILLIPSQQMLYGHNYFTIDGDRYFVIDKSANFASMKIYTHSYPKEKYLSLSVPVPPKLPIAPTNPRFIRSKHNSELALNIRVNKNLIDFYDDCIVNDYWNLYSAASLSDYAKEQLYPVLRGSIAGKSKHAAANILLHFVQTALEYATDDEQFGYERPLFADETLFYPYSDCEDRAILYSILVRELLGLDVVLLHYPGHLATAVCFDTEVQGDYLQVDGLRYTVCDPTYINADVGQAMPQYKQTAARVIRTK
ncbi:MAG: hypothetical protein J1E79_03690 [Rikenella sp.]|nr:hypothetical protein [Rikenella sp.]